MTSKTIIDARWIGNHGIGRYAKEIISRIDSTNHLYSGSRMSPLDPIRLSIDLMKYKGNVFYSPGPTGPLHSRQKIAMTIHDLMLLDYPNEVPNYKRFYFDSVIKSIAKNADLIFTVSEFSRRKISKWLKRTQDIIIAPNGLSKDFFPKESECKNTSPPFFFYVGNLRPHKNLHGIIEAFHIFKKSNQSNKEFNLILTGESDDNLSHLIDKYEIHNSVVFLGNNLTDKKLADYYSRSRAVLIPSFYEGFGMPALEGMACGAPIVSSKITSLPEVLDDVAIYIDPYNPESIAEGMFKAHYDKELREKLIHDGRIRARNFTWDKSANIVNKFLHQL